MNPKDNTTITQKFQQFIGELRIDEFDPDFQFEVMEQVYSMLHKRVGLRLVESMSEAELKNFDKIIKQGDEAAAQELSRRFPDLQDVVVEELEELKEEIKHLLPKE